MAKIIYKWTLSARICRLALYNGKMDPSVAQPFLGPKRYTVKQGGGIDILVKWHFH
jgi:hypothetical protein